MVHTGTESNSCSPEQGFFGLGIAPALLEILETLKFHTPTPIQRAAIPLAIQGKDVIGIAQTGTGKTHAFAVPMVQLLAQREGVGFVLAPTRELALQIHEQYQPLVKGYGFRTACLIGGASMEDQKLALRQRPRIVIATPGRFIDHAGQWNVFPEEAAMLVLDEADRMLDMGFMPQVEKILQAMPPTRQLMLFSATMPTAIVGIAGRYMQLPTNVEIAPSGTTAEHVTQELYIVKRETKSALLKKVLGQYKGSVLLFTRTKHGAHKVVRAVRDMGIGAAEMHADRSLVQRREALAGFKRGRYRVLVATDIASRGIDVTGIELVINYDLPDDPENYVHRIGRTGRAGCTGHAISFATPDQQRDVDAIERLIRATLPRAVQQGISQLEFSADPAVQSRAPAGQRRRGAPPRSGGPRRKKSHQASSGRASGAG